MNLPRYQSFIQSLLPSLVKECIFVFSIRRAEFLCLFWFYIDQWWTKRKALAATNFPAATLNTNYQTVGGASSTSGGLHQKYLSLALCIESSHVDSHIGLKETFQVSQQFHSFQRR